MKGIKYFDWFITTGYFAYWFYAFYDSFGHIYFSYWMVIVVTANYLVWKHSYWCYIDREKQNNE